MLPDLPRRTPGRTDIPAPKRRRPCPTTEVATLQRIADTLRQPSVTDPDHRRPQ